MTWIKRNLFFLIGILVALLLIGAGGFYCYSEYTRETELHNKIEELYSKLRQLSDAKPHPGDPNSGVDNVKAARDQAKQALDLAESLRAGFKPVSMPPVTGNFQHQMDSSIGEMRAAAAQSGVSLPTVGYNFTFQTETKMVNLPQRDFPQIAAYMSEIKAICDTLFAAKVNSIDTIQRPLIAGLETNGPDFLPAPTNSTPLADITPYKVSFRCFSGELGTVMASLASSPHGLIVKYVDVDPGQVRSDIPVPLPPRNGRPATFLNENLLQITLLIDVVKPKTAK